jgi:hypothetical protein
MSYEDLTLFCSRKSNKKGGGEMTKYKKLEKGDHGTLWALMHDNTYQEARLCFQYWAGEVKNNCLKVFIVADNSNLPNAYKELCVPCQELRKAEIETLRRISIA